MQPFLIQRGFQTNRLLQKRFTRSLFIQSADTPNPLSRKFTPTGKEVLPRGSAAEHYQNIQEARSPLARLLFQLEGVKGVFLTENFITVTIEDDSQWMQINNDVLGVVMDFYASGQSVLDSPQQDSPLGDEEEDEVVMMIKELLDTQIRPNVQADGGDVRFVTFDYDTGIVKLELQGACQGCSSSNITLYGGIQRMLMYYIPEVQGIEEVQSDLEKISSDAFEQLQRRLEKEKGKNSENDPK